MANRHVSEQAARSLWRGWCDGSLQGVERLTLGPRLLEAGLWREVHALLTDFAYPLLKIRAGSVTELIIEYDSALENWAGPRFPDSDSQKKWTCLQSLRDWRNYVVDFRHALAQPHIDPAVLAWNRADHGPVTEAAQRAFRSQPEKLRLLLDPRPPLHIETPEVIAVYFGSPYKVRTARDSTRFLIWTDDCWVGWIDNRNGSTSSLSGTFSNSLFDAPVSWDETVFYRVGAAGENQSALEAVDIVSGKARWKTLLPNVHNTYAVFPSGDSLTVLVTISDYGPEGYGTDGNGNPRDPETTRLYLLSVETGAILHQTTFAEAGIRSALFPPDGSRILLFGKYGVFHLWDLQKESVNALYDAGKGPIVSALSPGGGELVVFYGDRVEGRGLNDGACLRTVALPCKGTPLAISEDLSRVALSESGVITAVELPNSQVIAKLVHPNGNAWAATFTPDGLTLGAVFGDNGILRVWRLDRGSTPPAVAKRFLDIAESRHRFSGLQTGLLLEKPSCLPSAGCIEERFLLKERDEAVWVFSDGTVAVCSVDGTACLRFRRFTSDPDGDASGNSTGENIQWTAINAAGNRLALYCSNNLQFVDLETFAVTSHSLSGYIDDYCHRTVGDHLYTLTSGDQIALWSFTSGNLIRIITELGETFAIPVFQVSPDEKHLIVYDCHGLMTLFDVATGQPLASTAELLRVHHAWMKDARLYSDVTNGAAYNLTTNPP